MKFIDLFYPFAVIPQVVVFMPEGDRTRMGGTMRLGSRATVLRPGSQAFQLYGGEDTEELEVRDSMLVLIDWEQGWILLDRMCWHLVCRERF